MTDTLYPKGAALERYIVNSSDPNDFYSFFLPIVSLIWKRYIGYEPISLLYGTESEWRSNPKTSYVLDVTKDFSRLEFVKPVEGYKVSTVMQVSRLFAAALPSVKDDDYLLTSDVDLIPLNAKAYFNAQDLAKRIHLFGADAYADITKGLMPPKYPMCHLGARAVDWRDVLGMKERDIDREIAAGLEGRADSWDNDEMYFASRLMRHRFYEGTVEKEGAHYRKGECHLLIRTWPFSRALRRIDRDAWHFSGERDMIDCHAVRPGYRGLDLLLPVLKAYFPSEEGFFRCYVQRFMELKKRNG